MTTQQVQKCEFGRCRNTATQADTHTNNWFCDNHYSLVGKWLNDGECSNELVEAVDRKLAIKSLFL